MADKQTGDSVIISYKKGSRSSTDSTLTAADNNETRKNRRNALKEFYKLKRKAAEVSEDEPKSSNGNNYESIIENDDDINMILKQASLKDLITLENKVHYKINSNKSLIKNIIYNNYFELIKINGHLSELVVQEGSATVCGKTTDDDDDDEDLVIATTEGSGQEQLEQLGLVIGQPDNTQNITSKPHVLNEVNSLQNRLERIQSLSNDIGSLNFIH